MANLVEQIFAQSKAGSSEGESLPVIQAFTAGSQLRTEELRRQALDQSIAFNEKMNALKLTEAQLNMQRIQESTAASGELAGYMLDASSRPDGFSNPEVVSRVKTLLLKHPILIGTPIGTQALGQITAAARLHQLIPGGTTGIEGTKFEPHINAKGEVSYVPVKTAASEQKVKLVGDLTRQLQTETDPKKIEILKSQLESIVPAGEQIEIASPDGTKITIGRGGKQPGDFTSAELTRLQTSSQSALDSVDSINRLLPMVSSETFGPRAFVEHIVKDKILSNIMPDLASPERATAANIAKRVLSDSYGQLRSDGNISEPERREIKATIPEPNQIISSPADATNMLKAAQKTSALRALTIAHKLKQPVPKNAALVLDPQEIIQAKQRGLISKEEATTALGYLYP